MGSMEVAISATEIDNRQKLLYCSTKPRLIMTGRLKLKKKNQSQRISEGWLGVDSAISV